MEAVANYFYIPVEQMISKDRSKDVAYRARWRCT